MKKFNLASKATLALLVLNLSGPQAFARTVSAVKPSAIKSGRLSDPYYQIQKATIIELTPEEELEFIGDLPGLSETTNATSFEGQLKANRIPRIPPRPPETTPPITDIDTSTETKPEINKGGTDIVAAGGGGTSTTGAGIGGILDNIIMVTDKVAAIGQKIMPLIEKGRPIVTNNPMAAISVIPRFDSKDPVLHDMEGWSIPMSKHYKIAYSNGYGGEVVSFVYSISYQYGGKYLGLGKYLTGIRASARNIVVNWGFDLDASSQLVQISNIGTSKAVVAGATVEISYTVKNWSRVNTTNEAFFISGDGKLYKMD